MTDNGLFKTRQKIILFFGVIATLFGFAALAAELWRTWTNVEGIRVKFLGLASVITLGGLVLIQTLAPLTVVRLFGEYLRARYVGGRRASDPPPDTAPPPVPRHKWPDVPPRPPRGD